MEEHAHHEAQQRAMVRLLMKELDASDASYMDALHAEVRERYKAEDYAKALAEVEAKDAARLDRLEEVLKDRYAERQRTLQRESDQQEEAAEARLRKEITDEVAADLADLQRARERLRQQRDLSDSVVVELLRQLCPDGQHVFLFDYGVTRLRLHVINTVLMRQKLRLRARVREGSTRIVACELAPGRGEGRHVFWLATATPEGVIDEDEDAGALALPEASPDGPTV